MSWRRLQPSPSLPCSRTVERRKVRSQRQRGQESARDERVDLLLPLGDVESAAHETSQPLDVDGFQTPSICEQGMSVSSRQDPNTKRALTEAGLDDLSAV